MERQADPLRAVRETLWKTERGERRLVDHLECGHFQPVKFDKFKVRTVTQKRRCWRCGRDENK